MTTSSNAATSTTLSPSAVMLTACRDEDEDSEVMLHVDLQGILAPVPAMSTAKAAKRKTARVGICPHQRQRSKCKECGGASICPHQRRRSTCKECREEADTSMPAGLEELVEAGVWVLQDTMV